ncbi:hypothetical protein ACFX13_044288 [Malus domestica]
MLDVLDSDMCDLPTSEEISECQHMELSSCAFYDTGDSQTARIMKVEEVLNGHSVRILLDSGSTHNFVDSKLLKQ